MKTVKLKSSIKNQVGSSTMAETEGARRATGVSNMVDSRDSFTPLSPDPEVSEKRNRRKFTAKYKLQILEKADACTEPGQIGSLLRSEGLYSSNIATWRRQREKGILKAMIPKKRGRKRKEKNPLAQKVAQLEKKNRRLQQKLKKAELIIEAQKKMSEILGIAQDLNESDESK